MIETLGFISVILAAITAGATIWYTTYTRELVRAEFGPKLYVKVLLEDSHGKWNKVTMAEFGSDLQQGIGFCPCNDQKWTLTVINNGQAPATNIVVKYSLCTYIHESKTDGFFVESYWPKIFKEVVRETKIDYLPPGDQYSETIIYLSTFPIVECSVGELKCKEKTFITKRLKISEYMHPEFEKLRNTGHLRELLGLNNDDRVSGYIT